MAKRPDMQVVGAKIAHLRREKGLCTAAFAREIEQPIWLLMLLESAHMEQSKQLIELLPDAVIDEFLREIREVYGVSKRWLTTQCQSSKQPPLPDDDPSPMPLLLPVAIYPEDTLMVLDDLMTLALLDSHNMLQNDGLFRQGLKAVMTLHQLQVAHLRKHGQEARAEQHRQRFNQLWEEHVSSWMKEFHITASNLTESAVTV